MSVVCLLAVNAILLASVVTLPILRLCARPALLHARNALNLRQIVRSVLMVTGCSTALASLAAPQFTSLKANPTNA